MPQSQKPSRPRCAVVSLRLPGADWIRATEASVEMYAQRHGLELVSLREERLDLTVLRWRRRYRNRHLEKFQIHDLLADYDRILYVDADVLIHPDAPNIFERVPDQAFGAVDECVGVEAPKREQEWRAMQRRLGRLDPAPVAYFNAGVMVASRVHGTFSIIAAGSSPLVDGRTRTPSTTMPSAMGFPCAGSGRNGIVCRPLLIASVRIPAAARPG